MQIHYISRFLAVRESVIGCYEVPHNLHLQFACGAFEDPVRVMASWARAARRCVQAGAASMLRPAVSATGEAQAALRPSLPVFAQQSRGMASSGTLVVVLLVL